jgi:hypothetical protein
MYPPHSAIPDLKLSSEPPQASVPSPTPQSSDGASLRSDGMLHTKSGLQQPHHSTPSPYACSSRSKMIIDTGSVSDSGITSRTNRLPRYLDVSLAHKASLSPLNMRHPSPSSPNLSLSGYLSDGCIFERSPSSPHPSRLDVKRLLSKPAALSVVSTVSISSDSESLVPPRSALNPSEAWPSKARVQASPRLVIDSPSISRSESPQPEQSPTPPPPSLQRPRNVLRKKSPSPQTRAAILPSDISISYPPQSSTNPPAAVTSRSQRSTALQSLIRSRAATPASAPPSGSGRQTPAGAIIQAYKEQDCRREALAAAANVEKRSPIIPISSSWLDPSRSERNPVPTAEGAPSSSDSFIMVDDPRESSSRTGELSSYDPCPSPHSSSPSASQPIKSLTRKVSSRFRRGLAAVSGTGTQPRRGYDDGEVVRRVNHVRSNTDVRARPERQLSLDPHRANRKPEPLRLSIDMPPPSGGLIDSLDEHSSYTTRGASAVNSPYTLTQSKGKEKERADTSTGTRLWRLVKRISTGALRERFQSTSESPPPVPAIPRELPPLPPRAIFEVHVPSESTGGVGRVDSSDGGEGGKGVMNYGIDSNLSASGLSSHSDGHSSTAAYMSSGTHGSLQGHGVGEHPRRPSLSSSPQSSEPASTHFFRSHSSRSSFSSIIGNSPPRQAFPIYAKARSPSPRAHPRTEKSSTSSARTTSHDESQSPSSVHTRARGRSTPDIPTFSVPDVLNNFILRRPSLVRHQRHHAPTRSMIFPRTSGGVSAAPLRRAGSEVRRTTRQRAHVDPISAPGSSGQNRDSQGSETTVRQPAMSTATASAGANANTGGSTVERYTFRELGRERKAAWTSQEKEDKWHALLEKSARAGGTLHLGVGSAQLASDNIRFSSSTYSSEMLV